MPSRTNTGKRLVNFLNAADQRSSRTVLSKRKQLPYESRERLAHQFDKQLTEFRESPLRTAAQVGEMIMKIDAAEDEEIAYMDKHAPLRLQNRLSSLRDIIEDLRECQTSIDLLNIRKNFIPRYLGKSSKGCEKHLRHEENLRSRNSRCRTVMSAAWKAKNDAERQRRASDNFTRGLSDAGAVKKRRTRRKRRPKRQTIRHRRKKRKSKMTRFWRDRK